MPNMSDASNCQSFLPDSAHPPAPPDPISGPPTGYFDGFHVSLPLVCARLLALVSYPLSIANTQLSCLFMKCDNDITLTALGTEKFEILPTQRI
jgi:hypothetical protein